MDLAHSAMQQVPQITGSRVINHGGHVVQKRAVTRV
jgi:hypothetical protein